MIFNIDIGMKNVTPSLNTKYPADVTVIAGNSASFTVFVTDVGFPKDHVLQWFVNGVAIAGATEASYVRDTSGDKGQLSVWCEVTNKAGTTISRKATLTVNKLPVLNGSYPANTSATIGNTVSFKVSIAETGYPNTYSYQWYLDGAAVSGANSSTYTRTTNGIGTSRVYCVVSNDAGSVTSRTASYDVKAESLFTNGTFHIGGSVDWTHNSDTYAECNVTNTWHLGVDGTGHFGASWSTAAVNVTGKNRLIFTVPLVDTTGNNSSGSGVGTARLGITNSANLGNLNFVAQTSFRTYDNSTTREFSVDVSAISGSYFLKIAIDRTQTSSDQDHIYVSAIRFE